jgi:hypothetical protein
MEASKDAAKAEQQQDGADKKLYLDEVTGEMVSKK